VELAVGLWFLYAAKLVLSAIHLDRAVNAAAALPLTGNHLTIYILDVAGIAILGFLLLGLMVMDWQTQVLPYAFTLWGILIGFLIVSIQAYFIGPNEDQVLLPAQHIQLTSPGSVLDQGNIFLTGPEHLVFGRITAICAAGLMLLIVRWLYKALRHREGMGLGDAVLLAMIAAFLGFWPAMLALFLGVVLAAFYAIVLLARGKANGTTRLAFGSFLALGGLIAALHGNRLIDMYVSTFR
jgi:leader peptidase (prepilin peptidase)/N-methyltransferase